MTKKVAIAKTVYPMDYNKNDPMTGFNEWALRTRILTDMEYGADHAYMLTKGKQIQDIIDKAREDYKNSELEGMNRFFENITKDLNK